MGTGRVRGKLPKEMGRSQSTRQPAGGANEGPAIFRGSIREQEEGHGGMVAPLRIPASGRRNGCATSRHSFSRQEQTSNREPWTRAVFSQEDPKTGGLKHW
jgi:hypothetical protein